MTETALPPQRRLYMDGNKWCAVGPHFRNLQQDHAGFGDTKQEAVDDLNRRRCANDYVWEFEVGGFCRICKEWVPEGVTLDGCRDPNCPCAK